MPKAKQKSGMKKGMGPKDAGKTFRRLIAYLKPYRLQLAFVVGAIVLSAVANVFGTLFIKTVVDDHIEPLIGTQNPDFSGLLTAILSMISVYAVGIICTFLYNRLMVNVSTGTMNDVRVGLFRHLQKMPIQYFDTHTHGELMTTFTNDTDTLREMLSQALPQMINCVITILGVVIAMLVLSPVLTLLVFGIMIVMLLFVGKLAGISGKYFVKQQKSLSDVNSYIEEMIEGQKIVKVFNHEDKANQGFQIITDELCKNATTANTCANILMPIMGNLSYVLYVLVAIVGSVLTINRSLSISVTVGTVIVFLQFSRAISQPIAQMSQLFNQILLALAGAERIFAVLDAKPEDDYGYVTLVNITTEGGNIMESAERTGEWAWKHPHKADGTVTYKKLEGGVEFDHVTFGYEPEKTVLNDISLSAKPGQKIALVGSTGAGKTTITNLINRFYAVPDGKIRYDGININKIKKDDLRRSLGMVLQDTNLFTGTILDNIRYGNLTATDDECVEAAKLANAHSFIERLPEGYRTVITGNGANLSQGQRQLLNIARALVYDPPVLVLDEATSSIDTRTEKLIEQGMDSLMSGRTTFIIAHRLSTIRNADVILVLEHGEIIEQGDHQSLLQKKNRYYELYTGVAELS